MNQANDADKKTRLSILLSTGGALAVVAGLLALLARLVPVAADVGQVPDSFIVSPAELRPEPLERLLYLAGISLFPLTVLSLLPPSRKIVAGWEGKGLLNTLYRSLSLSSVVLVMAWTFFALKSSTFIYLSNNFTPCALAVIGVTTIVYALLVKTGTGYPYPRGVVTYVTGYLVIAVVLLYSVFGLGSVTESAGFEISFSAVFNAVTQVFQGKELLVNLPHQYGLYPHFLEPLFRLTGLTVFGFTVVMGLLRLVFLVSIYKLLQQLTDNKLIAHLGFFVLVYYHFLFGTFFVHQDLDPYFQFHPIRTVLPAIVMYLVHVWLRGESKRTYYSIFILSGVALLWNFDSGFVTLVSWLMVLSFQECCRRDYRALLRHLATGTGIVALCVCGYAGIMFLKYGHFPQLSEFLIFQQLYYRYGYYMLPMPILHPWNLVMLVYAFGLAYALHALYSRRDTVMVKMVFFLSIFGVGCFSSYQGRSHDLVLVGASYPAILILTLFADYLWKSIKRERTPGDVLALYCIVILMAFCSAGLLWNVPLLAGQTYGRLNEVIHPAETLVKKKVAFVKKHTVPGEKVFIWSYLAGIYYLQSDTRCLPDVPGTMEMLLRRDRERVVLSFVTQSCKKVFIDDSHANGADALQSELINMLKVCGYKAKDAIGPSEMIYFVLDEK